MEFDGHTALTTAACTLDNAAFAERLAEWRALVAAGVTGCRRMGNKIELTLSTDGPTIARLNRLIALEKECCGPAEFFVEVADDGVRCTISAPAALRRAVIGRIRKTSG